MLTSEGGQSRAEVKVHRADGRGRVQRSILQQLDVVQSCKTCREMDRNLKSVCDMEQSVYNITTCIQ